MDDIRIVQGLVLRALLYLKYLCNQKMPEKVALTLDNAPCHPEEDILEFP